MSEYSCPFCLNFDGVNVSLIFNDMILWVGADEALKILKLPFNALHCLPDCEKACLSQIVSCNDNKKLYITALGVGILVSRLVSRGSLVKDCITNDNNLPERANAFANIFLTEVISEIKISRLLCGINKIENDILNILSEPVVTV